MLLNLLFKFVFCFCQPVDSVDQTQVGTGKRAVGGNQFLGHGAQGCLCLLLDLVQCYIGFGQLDLGVTQVPCSYYDGRELIVSESMAPFVQYLLKGLDCPLFVECVDACTMIRLDPVKGTDAWNMNKRPTLLALQPEIPVFEQIEGRVKAGVNR